MDSRDDLYTRVKLAAEALDLKQLEMIFSQSRVDVHMCNMAIMGCGNVVDELLIERNSLDGKDQAKMQGKFVAAETIRKWAMNRGGDWLWYLKSERPPVAIVIIKKT